MNKRKDLLEDLREFAPKGIREVLKLEGSQAQKYQKLFNILMTYHAVDDIARGQNDFEIFFELYVGENRPSKDEISRKYGLDVSTLYRFRLENERIAAQILRENMVSSIVHFLNDRN
jgi:hypothetical protein